jgi:hypothetical protein
MSRKKKNSQVKNMNIVRQPRFEVFREYRVLTPETILRTCQCEGCKIQAKKDSDNNTLTYLQTEITKVDGKVTDIETHAVPYIEIQTL